MENLNEDRTFDVLGYQIRLKAGVGDSSPIRAEDIVSSVMSAADAISLQNPGLERGQIAVLAALQFAGQKLELEKEFRSQMDKIETSTKDALSYIEEVIPPHQ